MTICIKLDENFEVHIDKYNNHMLYMKKPKYDKKDKTKVVGEHFVHTGTYHPNIQQLFNNALFPILRQQEADDRKSQGKEEKVPLEEFMGMLDRISNKLTEMYESWKSGGK